MMDERDAPVRLQIGSLRNLPTLSEASIRIVDAVNDPDIDIDKLTQTLALSPALVARLLGLANSAYFGKSRQIDDLRVAIVQVLGLDLVKCLTLGVILNVQFDTQACAAFDSRYFWLRSLVTAFTAQKLAEEVSDFPYPPSTAYTCGLLLYMGVLVLAYLYPEELSAIFGNIPKNGSDVGQGILDRFGQSHFSVAHQLFRKWHLSSVYQAIAAGFDDASRPSPEKPLLDLLSASRRISEWLVDDYQPSGEEIAQLTADSNLSADSIAAIIDELNDRKSDLQSLSAVMGG